MHKRLVIFVLFLTLCATLFSQGRSAYQKNFERADSYYEKGDYRQAIAELRNIIQAPQAADRARAFSAIGYCFLGLEDYANAKISFELSLGQDKDYLPALEGLAAILANETDDVGRLVTAPVLLKRAEELGSRDYMVYYYLACHFAQKKEKEKAVACLDKAIYFGFTDTEWLLQDEELANIRATPYFISLIKNPEEPQGALMVLAKARQMEQQRSLAEAIKYYQLALERAQKVFGETGLYVAKARAALGTAWRLQGDNTQALESHRKALEIIRRAFGEQHAETAALFEAIGFDLHNSGDFDGAIASYEKALAIRQKDARGGRLDVARICNNIGGVWYSRAEYDRAIGFYEKALAIAQEELDGNDPSIAFNYNNIGGALVRKGEFDRAIAYFEQALPLLLETLGENHPDTVLEYNNLGTAYLGKGEYEKAVAFMEKALAVKLRVLGENHPDTALSYNNLGSAYRRRGDHSRAVGYFEKALAVMARLYGENHPDTATACNNIGVALFEAGDPVKAAAWFERSLAIRLKVLGDSHPDVASSCASLGEIAAARGEFTAAIRLHERALMIRQKILGEAHPETGISYNNLATAWEGAGNDAIAASFYGKALAVMRKFGARQDLILLLENLGKLRLRRGEYALAAASFKEAASVVENARGETGFGRTEFMARNIDCYLYLFKAGALANDAALCFSAAEAMRARGFLDRLSLSAALSVPGISATDRQKMISLNDELESLTRELDHEISLDSALQNRGRLVTLSDSIAAREKEFQEIEARLMHNERFRELRHPRLADLASTRAQCADKTAILEFVIWEGADPQKRSWCIVITKTAATIVELDRAFDWSGAVTRFREAALNSVYDSTYVDEPGALLYGKLIAPLEKHLAGCTRLLIVPDGPLSFLPFDALRRDNKSPWLCETYSISLSPSISVSRLVSNRAAPPGRLEMAAFGGALYATTAGGVDRGRARAPEERTLSVVEKQAVKKAADEGATGSYYAALGIDWQNLPGTLTEVEQIAREALGGKGVLLVTGSDVTEAKVKELSQQGALARYRVVHFACHGYYDQHYPAFSSIIFSETANPGKGTEDGFLNVEEAALLDLNADLVTLSACETGLGKIVQGDGVIGLSRALLVAGANRAAVTLWKVADDATCEFMVRVYTKVLKEKKSWEKALQETKLEFIKSSDYASPYYWSTFIMYGY